MLVSILQWGNFFLFFFSFTQSLALSFSFKPFDTVHKLDVLRLTFTGLKLIMKFSLFAFVYHGRNQNILGKCTIWTLAIVLQCFIYKSYTIIHSFIPSVAASNVLSISNLLVRANFNSYSLSLSLSLFSLFIFVFASVYLS